MADYTVLTNFAAKDALASGNAQKQVRGSELDDEFDAIATAIATKADTAGPTFTGTTTAAAVTATTVTASGLVTALQVKETDPTFVDAYASVNQTSGIVGATITFDTETSDLSADFSASVFTAPQDGIYLVTANVMMYNGSGAAIDSWVYLELSGYGTVAYGTRDNIANLSTGSHNLSLVLAMTAGQTLTVKNGGVALSANNYVVGGRTSNFSVKLLSRV